MALGEDKGSIQGHQERVSFPMKGTSCVGTDKDSSSHGAPQAAVPAEAKARSGGSTIDANSAGVQSEPALENAETMTKKPSIPQG